jgi:hypothetical protein
MAAFRSLEIVTIILVFLSEQVCDRRCLALTDRIELIHSGVGDNNDLLVKSPLEAVSRETVNWSVDLVGKGTTNITAYPKQTFSCDVYAVGEQTLNAFPDTQEVDFVIQKCYRQLVDADVSSLLEVPDAAIINVTANFDDATTAGFQIQSGVSYEEGVKRLYPTTPEVFMGQYIQGKTVVSYTIDLDPAAVSMYDSKVVLGFSDDPANPLKDSITPDEAKTHYIYGFTTKVTKWSNAGKLSDFIDKESRYLTSYDSGEARAILPLSTFQPVSDRAVTYSPNTKALAPSFYRYTTIPIEKSNGTKVCQVDPWLEYLPAINSWGIRMTSDYNGSCKLPVAAFAGLTSATIEVKFKLKDSPTVNGHYLFWSDKLSASLDVSRTFTFGIGETTVTTPNTITDNLQTLLIRFDATHAEFLLDGEVIGSYTGDIALSSLTDFQLGGKDGDHYLNGWISSFKMASGWNDTLSAGTDVTLSYSIDATPSAWVNFYSSNYPSVTYTFKDTSVGNYGRTFIEDNDSYDEIVTYVTPVNTIDSKNIMGIVYGTSYLDQRLYYTETVKYGEPVTIDPTPDENNELLLDDFVDLNEWTQVTVNGADSTLKIDPMTSFNIPDRTNLMVQSFGTPEDSTLPYGPRITRSISGYANDVEIKFTQVRIPYNIGINGQTHLGTVAFQVLANDGDPLYSVVFGSKDIKDDPSAAVATARVIDETTGQIIGTPCDITSNYSGDLTITRTGDTMTVKYYSDGNVNMTLFDGKCSTVHIGNIAVEFLFKNTTSQLGFAMEPIDYAVGGVIVSDISPYIMVAEKTTDSTGNNVRLTWESQKNNAWTSPITDLQDDNLILDIPSLVQYTAPWSSDHIVVYGTVNGDSGFGKLDFSCDIPTFTPPSNATITGFQIVKTSVNSETSSTDSNGPFALMTMSIINNKIVASSSYSIVKPITVNSIRRTIHVGDPFSGLISADLKVATITRTTFPDISNYEYEVICDNAAIEMWTEVTGKNQYLNVWARRKAKDMEKWNPYVQKGHYYMNDEEFYLHSKQYRLPVTDGQFISVKKNVPVLLQNVQPDGSPIIAVSGGSVSSILEFFRNSPADDCEGQTIGLLGPRREYVSGQYAASLSASCLEGIRLKNEIPANFTISFVAAMPYSTSGRLFDITFEDGMFAWADVSRDSSGAYLLNFRLQAANDCYITGTRPFSTNGNPDAFACTFSFVAKADGSGKGVEMTHGFVGSYSSISNTYDDDGNGAPLVTGDVQGTPLKVKTMFIGCASDKTKQIDGWIDDIVITNNVDKLTIADYDFDEKFPIDKVYPVIPLRQVTFRDVEESFVSTGISTVDLSTKWDDILSGSLDVMIDGRPNTNWTMNDYTLSFADIISDDSVIDVKYKAMTWVDRLIATGKFTYYLMYTNVIDATVKINGVIVDPKSYTIDGNVLIFNEVPAQGSEILVEYKLNDAFIVDRGYSPKTGAWAKLYFTEDNNVEIFYEGRSSSLYYVAEELITNPLYSNNHTGFLYLSDTIPVPDALEVTVSPSRVRANGYSTSNIIVTVRDKYGNPVPNVDIGITPHSTRLNAYSDITDIGGQCMFMVTAPSAPQTSTFTINAGFKTATATIDYD